MYFYADIFIILFEYCELKEKLKLKSTTQDLYKLLHVTIIPPKYCHLINNKIIQNMKLHTLYASHNNRITDEGIKYMKLHTLYAYSGRITDEGIKNMKLHTLYTSGNNGITDEGIKNMKLHTLYAYGGSRITDEGIKNMKLHTLCANGNTTVSYNIRNYVKLEKIEK